MPRKITNREIRRRQRRPDDPLDIEAREQSPSPAEADVAAFRRSYEEARPVVELDPDRAVGSRRSPSMARRPRAQGNPQAPGPHGGVGGAISD